VGLVGGALLVSSLVGLYFINRDTRRAASRLLEEKLPPAAGGLPDSAGLMVGGIVGTTGGPVRGTHPVTLAERRAAYHRALRPQREPGSGEIVAHVPAFSYTYLDAADRERLRVDFDHPDMVGRGRDRSHDPVVRSVRRAGVIFGSVHPSRVVFGPPR